MDGSGTRLRDRRSSCEDLRPWRALCGRRRYESWSRRPGRAAASPRATGASSSIRFGGRSATPCDAIVRRRSTGSPPAPEADLRRACRHLPISTKRRPAYIRAVGILGVDVGGTFTDAVAARGRAICDGEGADRGDGRRSRCSRRRGRSARATLERFTHGTTVATNALLERKGARTAFVATAGFEHLLHLRRQNARASLPARAPTHPEPLVPLERCFGVRERIGPGRRPAAARPRLAAGDRRGGGRGLPALLVPGRDARAARSPRSCAGGCRARASSPRTRSRPSSASTSARRRLRSTPTSARSLLALPRARSRGAAAGRGCPSRSSCARRAASRRSPRRPAHPAVALRLRAGGGRRRRARSPLRGRAIETRSRSTWAARRRTSA